MLLIFLSSTYFAISCHIIVITYVLIGFLHISSNIHNTIYQTTTTGVVATHIIVWVCKAVNVSLSPTLSLTLLSKRKMCGKYNDLFLFMISFKFE